MYPYFDTQGLSADELLTNWRWLCPQGVRLIAVDVFGELFLEDKYGGVLRLDTASGELAQASGSLAEFRQAADDSQQRKELFQEDAAGSLIDQGFHLQKGTCLGYKMRIVFSESKSTANNVYVANLQEHVSFLGDLHEQLKDVPGRR